ncbi:MAG: hypothetical protein CMJ50_08840 [Planctomycetaceae bacterium]|nr:hypothetical protein [Planctomycetaceae bacterium]
MRDMRIDSSVRNTGAGGGPIKAGRFWDLAYSNHGASLGRQRVEVIVGCSGDAHLFARLVGSQ